MLTLALPTGRVQKEALQLLASLGLPTKRLEKAGRSLVIDEGTTRYLLAKPMDVPLYVHYGVADLALVGSDVLAETSPALIELADTGQGRCRLVVAGPKELGRRFWGHESAIMGLRVATKYPRIADGYFAKRGVQVRIISLNGSIELAPLLNLSDCILDIVQTGTTLEANRLVVLDEVAPVSLRLVASRRSAQLRWQEIGPLVEKLNPSRKEVL
ncbi:ATP phosphoribosyltransferase [Aminithiophilus ramosus]|uniref:ATP phosphoribosyltransferase n=2 Tax=Synergistales TaxID=649776 RepID=A0A9Q7EW61_9BACT|nr:ATP phosphoribosyltransferase [Aminithiophilus ramosus]QTX31435.1 ATP phosphoribosyltransferase [Aminithiophilus ramosus]QVL35238.1 ATP phosphoribosyltransferase [Synergistota bacterium]